MPLYQWVRTDYDDNQTWYDVWLIENYELVRVVNNDVPVYIAHGPKVMTSHSSTNPYRCTSDDDESD